MNREIHTCAGRWTTDTLAIVFEAKLFLTLAFICRLPSDHMKEKSIPLLLSIFVQHYFFELKKKDI